MVLLVHGGPWARDVLGPRSDAPVAREPRLRGARASTTGARRASGRSSSTRRTTSGPARCTTTCSTRCDWAVDEGHRATGASVAIMGGSYGGYATLVGLTFTPDVFACGVDIVGPSNLVTLLETHPAVLGADRSSCSRSASAIPAPRRARRSARARAAAAPRRPDQEAAPHRPGRQRSAREAGRERSDRQGDERARGSRSRTSCTPTRATASPARRTRMSFNAVAETFLAQCLGGSYEPVGSDFKGRASPSPRAPTSSTGSPRRSPALSAPPPRAARRPPVERDAARASCAGAPWSGRASDDARPTPLSARGRRGPRAPPRFLRRAHRGRAREVVERPPAAAPGRTAC